MRLDGIRCASDRLVEACPCKYTDITSSKRPDLMDMNAWEVHRRRIRVFHRTRDTIIYVYGRLGRIYVGEVIASSGCDILLMRDYRACDCGVKVCTWRFKATSERLLHDDDCEISKWRYRSNSRVKRLSDIIFPA